MKNIFNQVQATLAVATIASATLLNIPSANAASYRLDWTGNQGYSAQGFFGYDNAFQGGIVTREELNRFSISFFDPKGTLLQTFRYSSPISSSTFNFNFDTVTETILQTDNFDTPNGFDLGSNFNTDVQGLFFYTFGNLSQGIPGGTIFLKDDNSIEVSPVVCQSEPTNPNCRLDFGGSLTATLIPEPGTILGILAIGLVGKCLKKKPSSV